MAEAILAEWREKDPLLSDIDGFLKYFEKRYPKIEREIEKQIEEMVFALTAPLVVWPGETALDEWRVKATMYRLAKLMKGEDDDMATDWEAMIYISTASLSHPLDHEWYRIYMHLFREFYGEKADEIGIENVKLYDYEVGMLNDLKRWIRKRQMEFTRAKRG